MEKSSHLPNATEFLDSIVENIPLMIFVKDAEALRFERLNRAGEELLGVRRDEVLGRTDHELFTKEQADFFRAKDAEALASSRPVEISEEPVMTSRGERWLRTMKMAIRDEHGTAKHLVGISEDVTQRRELAEMLRQQEGQFLQAEKMAAIGQLVSGVAHDFNNLLSVILSYAEIATTALSPSDPLRDELSEISQAGERAAELTRQLLAFSRPKHLTPRTVDLNDVLASMHNMLRRVLEEDIELETHLSTATAPVTADPSQIEQIIMNLVVNARDAMPKGGKLVLETANVELDQSFADAHPGARPGPHILLSVTDDGVGMGKEIAARMFEPFFTTKALGKGTGLGLSTVYGIVRQSGGTISVMSEPGQGTSLRVYLPRAAGALDETTTLSLAPTARRGTETILVVEDEEQVLRLVRNVLRRQGYRVLCAVSPADAILVAEQHEGPIDLLLTDVVMPRMNGARLATRLRLARPSMQVLFMSGYADTTGAHQGLPAEGALVLQKPITPEMLLARVAESLATVGDTV